METEEHRVLSIRGLPDSTQKAEILIQETLTQWCTEITTVPVPSRTLGRIVGSNRNRIWNIGWDTGCKVEVEGHQTRIHLMGSPDGIETAQKIIED